MLGKVLIIGFGFLGQTLAEHLVEQGYEVFAAKRHIEQIDPSFHPISLDVSMPFHTKKEVWPQFDYVVYMVSAGNYSPEDYQRAYVNGVQHTVDFIEYTQPQLKRLLYISSTSVFEESSGGWVNEQSSVSDASFSSQALLIGESTVIKANIPATVFRLSGIYGSTRVKRLQSMVQAVINEEPTLQKNDTFTNRIHVEDAARAIHHVMTLPNPESLYIVSDTEPMKKNDITKWIANDLNKTVCPIEKESTTQRHGKSKRCSSQKLVGSGFQFKYPTLSEFYYKNKSLLVPTS